MQLCDHEENSAGSMGPHDVASVERQECHLDKDRHLCDGAHPLDKVPGQRVIHVGVEDVDSACCADPVMRLYSRSQFPQVLICQIISDPVPAKAPIAWLQYLVVSSVSALILHKSMTGRLHVDNGMFRT